MVRVKMLGRQVEVVVIPDLDLDVSQAAPDLDLRCSLGRFWWRIDPALSSPFPTGLALWVAGAATGRPLAGARPRRRPTSSSPLRELSRAALGRRSLSPPPRPAVVVIALADAAAAAIALPTLAFAAPTPSSPAPPLASARHRRLWRRSLAAPRRALPCRRSAGARSPLLAEARSRRRSCPVLAVAPPGRRSPSPSLAGARCHRPTPSSPAPPLGRCSPRHRAVLASARRRRPTQSSPERPLSSERGGAWSGEKGERR
nr:uncharacterized protein LOC127315394 [Lolium perenne]